LAVIDRSAVFRSLRRLAPSRVLPYFDTLTRLPEGVRGQRFAARLDASAPRGAPAPSIAEAGANPLLQYFDAHEEGPGILKSRHYFDVYHRHFARFTGAEVHIVEIGIYSGGSLGMWRHYFGEKSRIYGVDIVEDCKAYETENIRVFIGDQADRGFWRRFRELVPRVDIVIDDGGHQPEQQIVSLEELLPHLSPGGVYVCEDVFGSMNRFSSYVGGLVHMLNAFDQEGAASPANGLQRMVSSIHQYPHIVVLEKAIEPVTEFTLQTRGSQWQPQMGVSAAQKRAAGSD
jgi:hypothetical protein